LAAGCSPGGGSAESRVREAWRLGSITPIGQPVAAGGMVVVYGTEGEDLYLYGVAVGDGAVRWRQAASPSTVVTGIAVTPHVKDGRVAYFRPDPSADLAARLVVASSETGEDLLVSEPAHFTSHPRSCADDKDVCVTLIDRDGSAVPRRFSVEGRGPAPDAGAPPPESRYVGTDLLDLGQRGPEMLAGFSDGAVRWRSPLTRHFSEGFSTDEGWYFELYRSAGMHVGSVGRPADREEPSVVVVDLSKGETAAIEAATGSPAWRSQGTRFACSARVELRRVAAPGRSELWPVRCRYRGVAQYNRLTGAGTYEGLDVTVEGFDVSTGATTWSVPLGAAEAFMEEDYEATAVGGTEVLVQAASNPLIIDLADGSTRSPGKDEAFWCGSNGFFRYREPRRLSDGRTFNTWRGGTLLSRCRADGSPTDAVPRDIARSLGATVGDRTIVSLADGLVAYDRPGS
ncbi:MAG: PQQ-binding-like beta-propeller repeat protein, partial [Acidimicrobiales bacterium]